MVELGKNYTWSSKMKFYSRDAKAVASNDYAAVSCSYTLTISSLLISRHLTRPRIASRNYTCHECINVTRSGRGNSKNFECVSCSSG